jgi:hypothetical protein
MFNLLYDVACDDPFAAIWLLFVLGMGGVFLGIEWLLQRGPIVWFVGCFFGFGLYMAMRFLVDTLKKVWASIWTEKRKREWNFRQH